MSRVGLLSFLVVLMVCLAAIAEDTFQYCSTGERSLGLFTNFTGAHVDGLRLVFSGPLSLLHTVGVGADMCAQHVRSSEHVFTGFVVPYGTWEVDWPLDDAVLLSAAWLIGDAVVEEIDIHIPTARIAIVKKPGLAAQFGASGSIDPDGGPLISFLWQFSDGVVLEGHTVEREFANVGEYTVVLYVVDEDGKFGTSRRHFDIQPLVGPPYAVAVIGSSIDCDLSCDTMGCVDGKILGRPDTQWVSLGVDGSISVKMGRPILDGSGADLRIFEIGAPEPFDVFVSETGSIWEKAASGIKRSASSALFVDVDISGHTGTYWYVRVVDAGGNLGCKSEMADIDAIEVLNSL